MKTITKHFKTLKEAEDYQESLYDEFEYVRLVGFPSFSEEGIYTWQVRKDS